MHRNFIEQLYRQEALIRSDKSVALKVFRERIMSMMKDYNITMGTALLWDFEGFGNDLKSLLRENKLEDEFLFYLWQNNVYGVYTGEDHFYLDVFMGRRSDMVLKKV